jgi:hypothetical protein
MVGSLKGLRQKQSREKTPEDVCFAEYGEIHVDFEGESRYRESRSECTVP